MLPGGANAPFPRNAPPPSTPPHDMAAAPQHGTSPMLPIAHVACTNIAHSNGLCATLCMHKYLASHSSLYSCCRSLKRKGTAITHIADQQHHANDSRATQPAYKDHCRHPPPHTGPSPTHSTTTMSPPRWHPPPHALPERRSHGWGVPPLAHRARRHRGRPLAIKSLGAWRLRPWPARTVVA